MSAQRFSRLSRATLRANVRAELERASAADIVHGAAWYRAAYVYAADIADRNNLSIRSAAAIIAALSPSSAWERNVEDAYAVAERRADYRPCTYGANVRTAEAIRDGADPAERLGGRKVRAFWRCILAAGHAGDAAGILAADVCIDRHATAIACGRKLDGLALTARVYARIADAYREVAAECHVAPAIVQAVTWTSYRRREVRVGSAATA